MSTVLIAGIQCVALLVVSGLLAGCQGVPSKQPAAKQPASALPKSIPMPPMPPPITTVNDLVLRTMKAFTKPLPTSANAATSYPEHYAKWLEERAATGKRRSE